MKKVAFVVVLVAVIVGIVFGGLSMASASLPVGPNQPYPNCTPKPTPTPCCDTTLAGINDLHSDVYAFYTLIDGKLDNILNEFPDLVRMDRTVGNFTTEDTTSGLGDTNPFYSHWSITLWADGVDSGDWIHIQTKMPTQQQLAELTSSNYTNHTAVNFEFDGRGWEIIVNDASGDPVDVYYCITQIYSSQ